MVGCLRLDFVALVSGCLVGLVCPLALELGRPQSLLVGQRDSGLSIWSPSDSRLCKITSFVAHSTSFLSFDTRPTVTYVP